METDTPNPTKPEKRPERHRLSTAPRYRKDGTVKVTLPTDRDQKYLWPVLEHFEILPDDHIHAHMGEHGGNKKALVRHMGLLCDEPDPHLKYPAAQFDNGAFRSRSKCFALKDTRISRNFWHQLMANLVMSHIELGVRAEGLDLVTFDDILVDAPHATQIAKQPKTLDVTYTTAEGKPRKAQITPDWTPFGIGNGDDYKFYFGIEADCNSEDASGDKWDRASLEKKFREYLAVNPARLAERVYGLPKDTTFFFPFYTNLPSRVRLMKKTLLNITGGEGSPYFLFRYYPSYKQPVEQVKPDGTFLKTPMERAAGKDKNGNPVL